MRNIRQETAHCDVIIYLSVRIIIENIFSYFIIDIFQGAFIVQTIAGGYNQNKTKEMTELHKVDCTDLKPLPTKG